MVDARSNAQFKGNTLYFGGRRTGYAIVPDKKYPISMWRVRSPDGSLSDMINRSRAKELAFILLDRDLRVGGTGTDGPPIA